MAPPLGSPVVEYPVGAFLMAPISMIDSHDDLHALVRRAQETGFVALDTEFVWERTYYPRLGVIQLGFSEDACFLIDALAIDDLTPLAPLLSDPNVVKILHDPQQDLTILRRATGATPCNIFDTRRASGFVGLSATLSLGVLAQKLLGISLPKTATRTNWLQRPLSEQQTAYALDDVRYLPTAYKALQDEAEKRGRAAWLQEEQQRYNTPGLYEDADPYAQYGRISGTKGFSPQQRAVLRELAAWREEEAQHQDRPRGHILADKALANLARHLPQTQSALWPIRDLNEKSIRRYGHDLLDVIEDGLATPKEDWPSMPASQPPDESLNARVQLAQSFLIGHSLAADIDPALVASRSEVRALVADTPGASSESHPLLRGWRRAFAGEALLSLLSGQLAIRIDTTSGLPRILEQG